MATFESLESNGLYGGEIVINQTNETVIITIGNKTDLLAGVVLKRSQWDEIVELMK